MPVSKILKVNKDIGFIGVSFTPDYYKRAYKTYQNGDFRLLLALIERAEIDSFVAGCLNARNTGYKRKYSVLPATEETPDVKAAEFLTSVLNDISMREFFEDMMDARYKYYSVIGLEWDIVNGYQVPVYFEKYDQKYFRYDLADNILKIDFGKRLEEIPPDSAYVIEASRKPILLTVLKDYIRKEFGEENWSSFLEVFGEPFIFAEYPVGSTPDQIKQVDQNINKMAGSSRGAFPEGTKVTIQESKRGAGDQKNYVDDCKANISFALLGHEEAAGSDKRMQIGDTQSSIVATSKVSEDDMFWLEDKIQPFFKMILDRNFTVQKYPRLLMDKSDIIDPKTKLTAAQLAFENGGEIDPDFFREYGIPIKNEDSLKKKSFSEEFGSGV